MTHPPATTRILALDIGGANIKLAHSDGPLMSLPFALWQSPEKLQGRLVAAANDLPPFDHVVATMTGELCDCFKTKQEGVARIVEACKRAFDGVPVKFWLTDGTWADSGRACDQWLKAAASNWHALAAYIGRLFPNQSVLLIDTGSTTTDIIRIKQGRVAAKGLTDTARLVSGELVYIGAARTSLMALGPAITADGVTYPLMAEQFATTLDVALLLGLTDEDLARTDTADGGPATCVAAQRRLARMIGGDTDTLTSGQLLSIAQAFDDIISQRLRAAAAQVLSGQAPDRIVISGSGAALTNRWLGPTIMKVPPTMLADVTSPAAADAACAYALLQLCEDVWE